MSTSIPENRGVFFGEINMTTATTHDYYESRDLALCTALSLFYPIDSIDRHDPRQVTFKFKREDGFDQLLESYWKDVLRVSPQRYFAQLRALKARLYAKD